MLVLQFALDRNSAIDRCHPAPDCGVLQIVSGVATLRGELHPTELCVRPLLAALPRFAGEVRQSLEGFDLLRLSVELAKSILPRRHHWLGRFRRGKVFGLPDEFLAEGGLLRRGRTLINVAIKLLDA